MSKKINIIDDTDVRFFAGAYKWLIRIIGVIIICVFGYNTFMIGSIGYNTYKDWNTDNKLKSYIIELNTENDIYKKFNWEDSKEEYMEASELNTGRELAVEQCIKVVIFEVYLIFLFLYYLNLCNFLENDNLSNPFTSDSEGYLSSSIKFGICALAFSLFLGDMKSVTFETLLIISLIRYLVRKGNNYINET